MRMSGDALYALLPAIYRSRDAAEGFPLRALIAVVAEQAAVVEDNIEQLYDDQFVETCADWVAPYIGALVGYRPLHGVAPRVASPRAEVANVIAYRRRLGTALVLEQLARDVTGWPARAVEYFRAVATTQRMNHIRAGHHFAPDLRDWRGLEAAGGAFDPFTRTADMRSIARADGRYGLPNVGIHLWRLRAFARTSAPAIAVDAQRHLFSPLGAPLPLFSNPKDEPRISHAATPLDVPAPISRRVLAADLAGVRSLYGRDAAGVAQSLIVAIDGVELAADAVEACNLSDDGALWANLPVDPDDPVAIDPVLGRIALPPGRGGTVSVSYYQGFSAPLGGGEYERAGIFAAPTGERPLLTVPSADYPSIQSALDALPAAGGIVEIAGSGRFAEGVVIAVGAGGFIELRAANGANPHIMLTADLIITGAADSRATIDGLLLSGNTVTVPGDGTNRLGALTLRHCTLVPGRTLDAVGDPEQPGAQALVVAIPAVAVTISACITGPIGLHRDSTARISDSIVDAASASSLDSITGIAIAAADGSGFAGALELVATHVLGRISTVRFDLVSNSILAARLPEDDPAPAAIWAERRQVGCIRFSFVPRGSLVPKRFRCQPQLAIDEAVARREKALGGPVPAAERQAIARSETLRVVPAFTAGRFGRPAYAQLRLSVSPEIRAGADDEGEMGAFHLLAAPQRGTNLNIRLDEYLRFDLEAGVFFET